MIIQGAKDINMIASTCEKQRITLALTISAKNIFLKPFIIFKGKKGFPNESNIILLNTVFIY